MHLRLLLRFVLLTTGFALVTLGILGWQSIDFSLDAIWPMATELAIHPVHVMVVGMALIPPTLWEIFILEVRHHSSKTEDV